MTRLFVMNTEKVLTVFLKYHISFKIFIYFFGCLRPQLGTWDLSGTWVQLPRGMWDLSSQTRDQTCIRHWKADSQPLTTREAPKNI